jgi:hypothetical protein
MPTTGAKRTFRAGLLAPVFLEVASAVAAVHQPIPRSAMLRTNPVPNAIGVISPNMASAEGHLSRTRGLGHDTHSDCCDARAHRDVQELQHGHVQRPKGLNEDCPEHVPRRRLDVHIPDALHGLLPQKVGGQILCKPAKLVWPEVVYDRNSEAQPVD